MTSCRVVCAEYELPLQIISDAGIKLALENVGNSAKSLTLKKHNHQPSTTKEKDRTCRSMHIICKAYNEICLDSKSKSLTDKMNSFGPGSVKCCYLTIKKVKQKPNTKSKQNIN